MIEPANPQFAVAPQIIINIIMETKAGDFIALLFSLILMNNSFSQSKFISPGEQTGVVIDSLIDARNVENIEVRYHSTDKIIAASNFGAKSDDFRISGKFLILNGNRKNNAEKVVYYNLDQLINFLISDKKLVVYF